jgi:putative hydrolase of HD superfamily
MDTRKLIETLGTAENLKNNTRHSWTSKGRHESVAEHSWRLALFAYFLKDEFPEADMDKVIRMCLFHDMGEAFTGDIPSFNKTAPDEEEESRQLNIWVDSLPAPYNMELRALYKEMDALETLEARIYKALDKLEVIIQHNEAELSSWIPLEYTLNLDYGNENVAFSEYLTKLRKEVYNDTVQKIQK